MKGRHEHLVGQAHQPRGGPVRIRQRRTHRAAPAFHGIEDLLNECRIRAAKAIDGLLGVAYPYRAFGQLRQLYEDGQLKRIRVLELVDQHEIEFTCERFTHQGAALQGSQQQDLLIRKVDHAKFPLGIGEGLQGTSRQVEHRTKIVPHIIVKPVMGRMACGDILEVLHDAGLLGASFQFRQLLPGVPGKLPASERAAGSRDALYRVVQNLGIHAGGLHPLEFVLCPFKRRRQDCIVIALRAWPTREHGFRIAWPHLGQFVRVEVVGARRVHYRVQRGCHRVIFQVQPRGQLRQILYGARILNAFDSHAHKAAAFVFGQHRLIRRDAEFKAESLNQAPADAIDRADARLPQRGGKIKPPLVQQRRPRALAQLRGSLDREGGGQDCCWPRSAALQTLRQQVSQVIGLSAARPGADEFHIHILLIHGYSLLPNSAV
ncbi:hypothetical protein D3C73_789930 [compost metagenome]